MQVFTTNNAVVVALLQVGVILSGVLFAGVGGRIYEDHGLPIPTLTAWSIHSGLALLGVPLVWTYCALRVRRNAQSSDSRKAGAFVSGLVLVGLLLALAFYAGMRPTYQILVLPPAPAGPALEP